MAYSMSLRSPALASSPSSGLALEDDAAQLALTAGAAALADAAPRQQALADIAAELQRQLVAPGTADDDHDDDDTMSEPGAEEIQTRQNELNAASADFLEAVDTGVILTPRVTTFIATRPGARPDSTRRARTQGAHKLGRRSLVTTMSTLTPQVPVVSVRELSTIA